jgi:hypothetical protein
MAPTLQVFVGGRLVGRLEHGKARTLRLPACCSPGARPGAGCAPCAADASAALLVLVHAMGRNSAGCAYDFKGLVGRGVTLGGARPAPAGSLRRHFYARAQCIPYSTLCIIFVGSWSART